MTAIKLIAVLALVGANAFFVAAEFGLVAVRRTRVRELHEAGSRRAGSTLKALSELNLMLSGCQLGITFSSLGLGWIGEPAIAGLVEPLFQSLPGILDSLATHTTAVVIAFTIITFLHVVLGELVPKNAAIAVPETTALWVATPIRIFTFMFRPFIWLFNEAANVILKWFGVDAKPELGVVHTPDELAIIVSESERGGTIDPEHGEILTRTLVFPDRRAVEAMVPRVAAYSISSDASLDEVLEMAERTGHSRFPVWKERQDEFLGVVHLKDMLRQANRDSGATVGDAMRSPLLVPESAHLEDVLIEMRKKQTHFAIVLDEFGSTAGIITMEDILEELVGEIRDEYDLKEYGIKDIDNGFRVPGTLRPDELEDGTGCQLPDGEYETVAGYVLEQLGRMARRGDEVTANGGWSLRVANVRRRRILSVDVLKPSTTPGL